MSRVCPASRGVHATAPAGHDGSTGATRSRPRQAALTSRAHVGASLCRGSCVFSWGSPLPPSPWPHSQWPRSAPGSCPPGGKPQRRAPRPPYSWLKYQGRHWLPWIESPTPSAEGGAQPKRTTSAERERGPTGTGVLGCTGGPRACLWRVLPTQHAEQLVSTGSVRRGFGYSRLRGHVTSRSCRAECWPGAGPRARLTCGRPPGPASATSGDPSQRQGRRL